MSGTTDPIYAEAMSRFRALVAQCQTLELREPMAVALATADAGGRPAVRTVLLREFDERGFVFYTNSLSRKGREVTVNPRAAICVYWDAISEQVRIEGTVAKVSDEENDRYWRSRPRERQLGAWASMQSEKMESPEVLAQRYAEAEQRFFEQEVPRPDHWFGFRIQPDIMEFWLNRPARLHERTVYECQAGGWVKYFLYP